jgi:hypothetical protein
MTQHEQVAAIVAKPVGWSRRRKITIALALSLTVAAASFSAFWYFNRCGDCDQAPIICGNPCTLPTFGQMLDNSRHARTAVASVAAAAV